VSGAAVAIRHATAADVDAILDLWRRADAYPSVTDTPDDVARVVAAPHAAVFVAVRDTGEIAGSLIATFDGWRGNVYRMAVEPEARRRGVGLALAAEAERWLRAAGARRLTALVTGDDVRARAFWEAAGFELYAGMVRYAKNA